MTLPASITITQSVFTPAVEISPDAINAPPAGIPPYPVGTAGQTWYLTFANGALTWVQVQPAAPLTVSAPAGGNVGLAMNVTGTVVPPTDSVAFALGTSASAPPSSGFIAAVNGGGVLSGTLTPTFAGTFYVWAQDVDSGALAVSGPVAVAASSVTLSVAPMGTAAYALSAGATILVGGGIVPAQNAAVQAAFSASNTAPPTSWTQASVALDGGTWSAELAMPAAVGEFYVWVETADGLNVVVSTFTLSVVA